MQKDLKIGLILGLILVVFIGLRLATDPRLSTKARMEKMHEAELENESQNPPDAGQATLKHIQNIDNNEATDFESSPTNTNDSLINELDRPAPVSNQITTESATETAAVNKPNEEPKAIEKPDEVKTQKIHIVQSGDTLSGISQKYYGTANKWRSILEANRNVLKDPNKLQLGMKLVIPEQ